LQPPYFRPFLRYRFYKGDITACGSEVGFFSVVVSRTDRRDLVVRTRFKEDLDRLRERDIGDTESSAKVIRPQTIGRRRIRGATFREQIVPIALRDNCPVYR
jgi:hypothetical protein